MSFLAKELLKVAKNELQDRLKERKSERNPSDRHEQNMYPSNNQPYGQGYPSQPEYPNVPTYSSQPGYPGQPNYNSGGYPNQSGYNQSGYPSQPPLPYPPNTGTSAQYGFNAPPGDTSSQIGFIQPGYPPASQGASYPQPQVPGYAPSPAFPSNTGYPSQASGYPFGGGYSQSHPGGSYPGSYGMQQSCASDSARRNYPGPNQSAMYSNPSIKPDPSCNPQHDAETLRKAMKGFGCNKDKVVQVLCSRTNAQRQQISLAFKQLYGKDLISELKSELSGDFENLILGLMENPVKYDADQLRKAMAGIGTRESVLIEIMTTRNNAQIFQLKQVYKQLYGRELEQDLIGETSGHFKRLLVSLCTGARDESNAVDPLRANQDARKLYKAGEQRLGTDESAFNAILASQNYAQLRVVLDEYHKTCGHSIDQAIASEFSGDIRDGLEAVIKSIRNRPGYFAELLHNSMKGMGTRDGDLIRIVITRSEIDLADIRNEYYRIYGKSLESAISGDCSGAYKEGLIALVKGN